MPSLTTSREGLQQSPRRIPPRWFYDELGSALFDAICRLPWYEVTRAELRLLAEHASAIAAARAACVHRGAGAGQRREAGRPRARAARLERWRSPHRRVTRGARDRLAGGGGDSGRARDEGRDVVPRRSGAPAAIPAWRRPCARRLSRIESRQLRSRRGRSPARDHSTGATAGRFTAARPGSRQASRAARAGLRRSARRDRGVQSESAGQDEPRARRRRSTRARSRIGRSGTPRPRAWKCVWSASCGRRSTFQVPRAT